MARLSPNLDVKVDEAFDVAAAGVYPMRIKEVLTSDANGLPFTSEKGNTSWRVKFEFVDPTAVTNIQGQPCKKLGTIFDMGLVISPSEKQGKLRGLVEACGMQWRELDSEDLIGKEVKVKLDVGLYNGEPRNNVARYIK